MSYRHDSETPRNTGTAAMGSIEAVRQYRTTLDDMFWVFVTNP